MTVNVGVVPPIQIAASDMTGATIGAQEQSGAVTSNVFTHPLASVIVTVTSVFSVIPSIVFPFIVNTGSTVIVPAPITTASYVEKSAEHSVLTKLIVGSSLIVNVKVTASLVQSSNVFLI